VERTPPDLECFEICKRLHPSPGRCCATFAGSIERLVDLPDDRLLRRYFGRILVEGWDTARVLTRKATMKRAGGGRTSTLGPA
jgi:hypothetical protein